jgi:hypothetical protein
MNLMDILAHLQGIAVEGSDYMKAMISEFLIAG